MVAAELAFFYGVVLLIIWGGQWIGVRPPGVLSAVLLLLFCAASARRHGDTRETLGWDRRWLGPCARKTLIWAGPPLLVLDLRAVTFLDSAGVLLLLEAHRRQKAADQRLRLVLNPTQGAYRVLVISGLTKLVGIEWDAEPGG